MALNPSTPLSGTVSKEKLLSSLRDRNNDDPNFVCGCPSLNLYEIRKSWENYDAKALPGIMKWLESAKPQKGEVFQYDEVMSKLREYDPPHRYEFTFVREILLPELSARGIRNYPLDLIAVLYTLHVPCRECKFLSAKIDGDTKSCVENGDLFLQFQYEDTGEIWSYRIKNFEHSEIARLEVVK